MHYIRLTSAVALPDISGQRPFKAIVIVDDTLADEPMAREQQTIVSKWLVAAGCLYLMSWGKGCSSWNDSVNLANLEAFQFGEIPDDQLVVTTSHANEALRDVYWYSKYTAMHPCFSLDHTVLLHLSSVDREDEFRAEYAQV